MLLLVLNPGFQIPEEKVSMRNLTSPTATSGPVSWTDGNQKLIHQLVSGPILLGTVRDTFGRVQMEIVVIIHMSFDTRVSLRMSFEAQRGWLLNHANGYFQCEQTTVTQCLDYSVL